MFGWFEEGGRTSSNERGIELLLMFYRALSTANELNKENMCSYCCSDVSIGVALVECVSRRPLFLLYVTPSAWIS